MSKEFKKSQKTGKIGEEAAEAFIRSFGLEPKDVSEDPYWQKLDVDYLIYPAAGQEQRIEAKGRSRDWGDIGLELCTNTTAKTPGWAYGTKSDLITYYAKDTKILHVLDTKILQQWLARVDVSARYTTRAKNYNNGVYYSDSVMLPVPLTEARDSGWLLATYRRHDDDTFERIA